MRKIPFAGNMMIVFGAVAISAMLLVFVWPLGLGLAALFLASNLFSFLRDKRERLADKITPVLVKLRSKRRLASDELFSLSEPTAVR